MKNNPRIEGTYCAMITPFAKNGQIDFVAADRLVDFYIEKELDGIFAVSNVGEFPCLSMEDRKRLIDMCCQKGVGYLNVFPGVTDINFDVSLDLARYAETKGAHAVVLSAPILYKYNQDYLESFIRTFLKKTPLPVVFYNSPKYVNPVSFDFLTEIASHNHVIALKESSGDAIFLQQLISRFEDEKISTPVMLGFEDMCLTGLVHGASGSMTSSGGILPELMLDLTNSFKVGNISRAIDVQKSVSRIAGKFASFGLPHGYKMGMLARGFSFNIIQSTELSEYEAYMQSQVGNMRDLIKQEYNRLGINF